VTAAKTSTRISAQAGISIIVVIRATVAGNTGRFNRNALAADGLTGAWAGRLHYRRKEAHMPKPDLDSAYALSGTEEARDFYKDWATDYDRDFAEARGYRSPSEVARVFRAAARGDEPVLDVGAGTGLIGQAMAGVEIDALDLSPEMLAVARRKGVYRDLIAADLTGPLALPDGAYGGVVSAGTFTHGHVGPACLPELLRITRPGALFVCTVVPEVYDSAGFGSSLALLVAQGRITPVRFDDFAIYDHADDAHADARGLIMTFRRL